MFSQQIEIEIERLFAVSGNIPNTVFTRPGFWLFSTVNTFKRYYTKGFLDLLVDKCRKNNELQVRILINSEIEDTQLKETISNISLGLQGFISYRNQRRPWFSRVSNIF